MLPYFSITSIAIGPITIYVWGMLVALGFLLGGKVAEMKIRRDGGEGRMIWDLVLWLMVAGMVGGRLGHVLWYEPIYYWQNPLEIFALWHGGLSVFGGFLFGALVAAWFFRKRNVNVWRHLDAVAFGLPFGLWIGRIGCFLIHDHPGTATDFFLGVQYPDGVVRHDLGLYLSLNAFVLAVVFLLMSRRQQPTGMYLVVFAVWYGIARFFLDFLRLVDVRYWGLTPGQYFSAALFLAGIIGVMWIKKRKIARKLVN